MIFGDARGLTIAPTDFEPGECLVVTPSTGSSLMAPYNVRTPSSNVLTASQPVGSQGPYIRERSCSR